MLCIYQERLSRRQPPNITPGLAWPAAADKSGVMAKVKTWEPSLSSPLYAAGAPLIPVILADQDYMNSVRDKGTLNNRKVIADPGGAGTI